MRRFPLSFLSAVLLPLLAACGGGGGESSGPAKVVSVTVSLTSSQVEVGSSTSAVVQYFDSKQNALSGRTVSYSSSATAVATVDNNGTVLGVTPGSASITATVDGVSGASTLTITPAAVATVIINQRTPVVKESETLTLTATTLDRVGQALTGRTVAWSSANPTRATVTNAGVVSGVAAGSVYIRATSEGKADSVLLKVKGLNAPVITGGAPTSLVPGASATITGSNFGATPNDNELYVNGVRATITAASATSLTYTVPSSDVLPCVPNDASVPVVLVANADSATATRAVRMAVTRTLAVGQAVILTTPADLACAEYAGSGGKYLVTAFNFATTPLNKQSFQLVGAENGSNLAALSSASPALLSAAQSAIDVQASSPKMQIPAILQRHLANHLSLMQREARITGARRPAHEIWQARRARTANEAFRASAAAAPTGPKPPPALNSMKSFRMCPENGTSISFCDQWQEVRARAVYVGPKMVIYEDSLAPLAGQMDTHYQKIGAEFDQNMYSILENFGRPLAADTDLQWNGKIIALFTKRVNQYRGGGILGFVTACDFFPQSDPDPNAACPSSNEGSYFYAIVPDPNNTDANARISESTWDRYVRGTLIHEAKHITAVSERYVHDAARAFDDAWVEEATAQEASEIWSRSVYGGRSAKSDIQWSDGPQCDYAQQNATCVDPVEGILHHFNFLYTHYIASESKSIISDPTSPIPDAVIYGSSWSFLRYVTDLMPSEGDFLRSITQVKNDAGVTNIVTHSGKTFDELLGGFSLASLADNYPSATINDQRIKLQSWNTRDIFAGMNQFLVVGNPPRPAFPRAWPMMVRAVSFGNFSGLQSQVANLPGGGWAAWEVSGTQVAPQVLSLRSPTGGTPPGNVGLAIVRIQ